MALVLLTLAFSVPASAGPLWDCLATLRLVAPASADPFDAPPRFQWGRSRAVVNAFNPNKIYYSHGITVEVVHQYHANAEGKLSRLPDHTVLISRREGGKVLQERFHRSDRGLQSSSLTTHYPASRLSPEDLKGKSVLDLGTGGGQFVRELRELGIKAYGLDIILGEAERGRPDLFIEADARKTGLKGEQFDVVFCSWGLGLVEAQTLQEMRRVLKVGGTLRVAPLFPEDRAKLLALVGATKGLEIVNDPSYPATYLEIRRTR